MCLLACSRTCFLQFCVKASFFVDSVSDIRLKCDDANAQVDFCTSDSEPTQKHAMAVLTALLEMLRDEPPPSMDDEAEDGGDTNGGEQ